MGKCFFGWVKGQSSILFLNLQDLVPVFIMLADCARFCKKCMFTTCSDYNNIHDAPNAIEGSVTYTSSTLCDSYIEHHSSDH